MFKVKDGLLVGSTLVIDSSGNLRTAAATANGLTSPQTIQLTGAVQGAASSDFTQAVSITTTLSNTTVVPGSYFQVTVGADGRITTGTNPTTLAGFGITDAQPLNSGLTSLAGLTGTGVLIATATDNYSMRSIGTASATDIADRQSADLRWLQLGGGSLTGALTLAGDPAQNLQAATKQYVDNNAQGLVARQAVRVATIGSNITLSGLQTIDGVALSGGDRILVKDQTDPTQNGVYIVASGTWSLASDFNTWADYPIAYVFIEQGSENAATGWVCNSAKSGTIGTNPITWVQFSSSTTYTASNGIALTGSIFGLTGQAFNLSQVSTTGWLTLTGSGAATTRTFATSGGGLSITNPDGIAGAPTFSLATTLSNLAVQAWTSGTQVPVLTAANTWSLKTVGNATGNILDRASADSLYTSATNLTSGTLSAFRLPIFTGDATVAAGFGSATLTLATVLANTGTFGSATTIPVLTVNGKGLITAIASAPVTPPWSSISGKPSTLSGYGITDAVPSSTYTASTVLAMIETVDGANSGLDADLLDGQEGSYYTDIDNINAGVLNQAYGGTGMSSYTANSYVRANPSSVLEQRTPDQVRGDISAIMASITAAVAPPTPNPGDVWFDSTSGSEYTWYSENGQGQWVEFGPTGIYGVSSNGTANGITTTISVSDGSIAIAGSPGSGYVIGVSAQYTGSVNQSISNEANARVAAGTALQANISANANAITSLGANVTALSNTVAQNYLTVNSAVSAEVTRAQVAEAALASNVSAIQSGYLRANGATAMTGSLNMANHVINNVASPVLATDAAPKGYVDNAVAAHSGGGVVGSAPVFIGTTQPTYVGQYLWVQTGTGSDGNGITFWANV